MTCGGIWQRVFVFSSKWLCQQLPLNSLLIDSVRQNIDFDHQQPSGTACTEVPQNNGPSSEQQATPQNDGPSSEQHGTPQMNVDLINYSASNWYMIKRRDGQKGEMGS